MQKNNKLVFSRFYNKLHYNTFTTIRRNDHYKLNSLVNVIVCQKMLGVARIVSKKKKSLSEIKTEFLLQDTDKKNRKEAIKLLNSFYRKPIDPSEKLTVLKLKWIWNYSMNSFNNLLF